MRPTHPRRPLLGAHVSISGGLYRAVERAKALGCDCLQIFTTPPRGWGLLPADLPKPARHDGPHVVNPLDPAAVARFQASLQELALERPLSHTTYLINVASPDETLWSKSIDALAAEVFRCGQLAIPNTVLHPGAGMGEEDEPAIARAVAGLQEVERQTRGLPVRILLETTAGQGSQLGYRLEQLAQMLERLDNPQRFGVCLDTCHLFAAGYPLTEPQDYDATMAQVERLLGWDQIHAIHVNDSQKPLGSRRDRHSVIGQGVMGLQAFRNLVKDPRLVDIPMYLETPDETLAEDLATLRELFA